MTVVKFDKKVSGRGPYNEPYWISECGKYRIANMDCIRPFRMFRQLRTGFKSGGWPWIGVGSGYATKPEAILAANQHANKIPVD